jgi:hypothetical protein
MHCPHSASMATKEQAKKTETIQKGVLTLFPAVLQKIWEGCHGVCFIPAQHPNSLSSSKVCMNQSQRVTTISTT